MQNRQNRQTSRYAQDMPPHVSWTRSVTCPGFKVRLRIGPTAPARSAHRPRIDPCCDLRVQWRCARRTRPNPRVTESVERHVLGGVDVVGDELPDNQSQAN